MTDHSELRRLAEAATPGPWFLHDFTDPKINSGPTTRDVTVSCDHPATITVAEMGGGLDGHTGIGQARNDAAYITAANPARILALLDEIEALKREREWQPIETAPKDGTAILGACFWTMADGVYRLGWSATGYVDERGVWSFDSFDLDAEEYNDPTHWMPLPKGPAHD